MSRWLRTLVLALLAAAPLPAQEGGLYGHYTVEETDLPPRSEYAARRAAALAAMRPGSALLLLAPEATLRNGDVEFTYRQSSNLLYLTGVTEQKSALLLVKDGVVIDGTKRTEVLFVGDRNPHVEQWTGVVMGPEVAARVTGVPTVLSFKRLSEVVTPLLSGVETLYFGDWRETVIDEPILDTSIAHDRSMARLLKERFPMLAVRSPGEILNPLRSIKSAREIEIMRRAIAVSIDGHRAAMAAARPGVAEYELEAEMEHAFARGGAEEEGYPSIVGSGPNTCILHYVANRRRTKEGDLVLMDCGAEYHGYSADITRTFPVSGRFTPEQRAIYDLVLRAQQEAIELCRVGKRFGDPHQKAVDVISQGLVDLGIIEAPEQYGPYFPHGTSHFLGLDVHDVGTMGALKAGMVLTVEPGIYIPAGSDCDPKWWNIGVRIEDDILVTADGPVNLSSALPRTADEIEEMVQGGARSSR